MLSAPGIDVNIKNELYDTPLDNASEAGHEEIVELLIAAGAEGVIENQQNNEGEVDDLIGFEEEDVEDDYDDEDSEEEITVWKGNIFKMDEHYMYLPGDMPKLLNVGENDRLMFVRTIAQETSNEWSNHEDEYIGIWLKREGSEWENICWPKINCDESPNYPEDWEEILDLVWNEKTVTYTTKLNEDYDQVEATWEVES